MSGSIRLSFSTNRCEASDAPILFIGHEQSQLAWLSGAGSIFREGHADLCARRERGNWRVG
jgi:hypothetical protein